MTLKLLHSFFTTIQDAMASDTLSLELTAPNGRKYTQPTGLFINNEFVKSSDGGKISSVNPTYVAATASLPSSSYFY